MEPTNDLSVRELKSFIVSRGGDPSLCSEKSELLALAKQLATPVAPVTYAEKICAFLAQKLLILVAHFPRLHWVKMSQN